MVTDIIYLRNRYPDEKAGDDSWVKTETVNLPNEFGELRVQNVNPYFIKNPDKVIGRQTSTGSMYRPDDYNVERTTSDMAVVNRDIAKAVNEVAEKAGKDTIQKRRLMATPAGGQHTTIFTPPPSGQTVDPCNASPAGRNGIHR